jgi:glycosyltransferase involved in cell wall biosynthesis
MKILFLTNVPAPYRVRFFNELAQYCDLTVVYEKERSDERDARWTADANRGYHTVFLKGIRTATDSAFAPEIGKYLKKGQFDLTVICGISSPTQMLAIQLCRLRGIPYAIEGDGAFPKDGRGLREAVKRYLIGKASLCFSTCRMHDAYYLQYGAAESALVRYPFSSVDARDVRSVPVSRAEKLQLRQELGIREDFVLLAVGQFIHRKGFDVLLEAARELPKNVGIYIVGGEPTDEYLSLREKWNLNQVHFVGFMTKEALSRYYLAADAFVLPTREDIWGLVVNEAMACGLPVITTTRCNAGLELVQNGVNGYLTEPEDAPGLAQAVAAVLASDREAMAAAALETARGYTIEAMALRHRELFTAYLEEMKQ